MKLRKTGKCTEFLCSAGYWLCPLCCRLVLTEPQKRLFEKLSMYCDKYAEQIPVTFVLGTSLRFLSNVYYYYLL